MPRGQEERSKLSTIILPAQNLHVLFHRPCQVSQTRGCQLLQKIIWDTTFLWARVYGFMCNEPLEGLYHHLIVSVIRTFLIASSYCQLVEISHCPPHIVSLLKPRSLEQRARMNVGWLDSSLSIMEQVKYNRVIC